MGLIDPQAINVTPKSAGCRQSRKVKKTTDDGVQTNICETPQPVEPYEYQHQYPHDHPVITQPDVPTGRSIKMIKNLFKLDQVQKFN